MTILLAIDGVLITIPPWQKTDLLDDGFPPFDKGAAANLQKLIRETSASVVLTTTQRIEYKPEEWKAIFYNRGIEIGTISSINDRSTISIMPERVVEVEEWVAKYGNEDPYVIIDDDDSLHDLPAAVKSKWVTIKPMLGLDDEATANALAILKANESPQPE
jgi:hypothetical protein